jgi:hypothetical protein
VHLYQSNIKLTLSELRPTGQPDLRGLASD